MSTILCRHEYVCTSCGLVSKCDIVHHKEYSGYDYEYNETFVGEQMVYSLLFEEGKTTQIMYLYEEFKLMAERVRVGSIKDTVCALLVFTTYESNLEDYCLHFDLDKSKVYETLQEIKKVLPACVSRYEQICGHVRQINKTLGLFQCTVPLCVKDVCSSEHIVAAAFVHINSCVSVAARNLRLLNCN